MKESRKKNRKGEVLVVWLTIFCMLLCTTGSIWANYDANAKGSIEVVLPDLSTEKSQVGLSLYKVGDAGLNQGCMEFRLDASLESTGIDLNQLMTEGDASHATASLASSIEASQITPVNITTDAQGRGVFAEVEQGVYLIMQRGSSDYGSVQPSLVSLPYMEDGENWKYHVDITAKASTNPVTNGVIKVTKKISLMDADGKMRTLNAKNATYYVGLFYDEAGTIPYGEDSVKTIEIRSGSSGTVVYNHLNSGSYYIMETDEQGNPICFHQLQTNSDKSRWYCIIGDGQEGDTNCVNLRLPETASGSVVLHNVYQDIPQGFYLPDPIVTNTPKPTATAGSSSGLTTSNRIGTSTARGILSVKTGDDTQLLLWIIIGIAALGMVGAFTKVLHKRFHRR